MRQILDRDEVPSVNTGSNSIAIIFRWVPNGVIHASEAADHKTKSG